MSAQNKQKYETASTGAAFKYCPDSCNLQDTSIVIIEFMTAIQQSFYICLTDRNFIIPIILGILFFCSPVIQNTDDHPKLLIAMVK